MTKLFATCLILICSISLALADTVYTNFNLYYANYQNQIFKQSEPLNFEITQQYISTWHGFINKKFHTVKIANGFIKIDNNYLNLISANIFMGEQADDGVGLAGDKLYFSQPYVCIEAIYPSASGMSARHKSIYLINLKELRSKKEDALFLLPSLFGTCLGLRFDEKHHVSFDKISYQYDSSESPIGILFQEYYLEHNSFIASGKMAIGHFSETNNVHQFYILPSP